MLNRGGNDEDIDLSICVIDLLIVLNSSPGPPTSLAVPRAKSATSNLALEAERGLQEASALPKIVEITSDSVGDIM